MVDRSWDADPDLHDRAEAERKRQRVNGKDQAPWREIEIVRFADIQPRLDTRPLVKGVLEHEQLSLFFGDTGCGKTFLALDMNLHIAAGRDWLGRRVDPGAVVYVAAEAGRGILNRVAAFKIATGITDIPFFAVTSTIDLCHADKGDLARLIATITKATEQHVVSITIDTVSRVLAGGDENGPADMGALVNSLDCLRDAFKSHIAAVHHCGKNHALGARGHSLLKANLDTEIEVAGEASARTATVTKQRDGATGVVIPFRLRQIELGRNLDGDPVTSCVVEPAEAVEKSSRNERLSAKQQIALDTLKRTITAHGSATPGHNHIPPKVMIVSAELWRRFYLAGTSADDRSEDTRRKAWRDARDALIARKHIGMIDDNVWII